MTKCDDLTIGIVGSGGDGVITAGELLVSSAANEGLFCFMLKSYGPQIRGGESSCRVRMSENQVFSQGDKLDILVVFNWSDYDKFKSEMRLKEEVVILYDAKDSPPISPPIEGGLREVVYEVPFERIAKEKVGTPLAKNIVALGVLTQLFNLPLEGLERSIEHKFDRKRQDVVVANLSALKAGVAYARDELPKKDFLALEYTRKEPRLVMSGNEALAFGALVAGCRFFAGYPITPASEIMEWMDRELPKFDGTFVQAEDEIAALGMVIGASFAGVKAMTATSGPGLSLMSEMIGLASMAEIPCVIVDVQRVGPSTGIPSKTEQGDLQQALYGTNGDAPRVVMAASDVQDCFDVTIDAFYVAEKYQVPVVILSDQFIGQRLASVPRNIFRRRCAERLRPTEEDLIDYKRFKFTEAGVSPMTHPGIKGGEYVAAGIEHDEYGIPSSVVDVHEKMNEKRFKKFDLIGRELDFVRRYGPESAEVGVIAWGSSKSAVKEAVARANEEGYEVTALIPQVIYPLALNKFDAFLKPLKKLLVIELSYSAQFLAYLKGHFELPLHPEVYKRSGGMPLTVEEVYSKIREMI